MKALSILILICIVFGAGYLLLKDYQKGSQKNDTFVEQPKRLEVFGQTGMVENSVSLQAQGGLWTPLEVQNTIYIGDGLRTAEASMTTVRAADLTILDIHEKSLIMTELSQGALGINIKVGDVLVRNSTTRFQVKNREAVIQGLEGSDYKVVAADNGDTLLSFIKGKGGVVIDRNKKKIEANEGDEVQLRDGVYVQMRKSNAINLLSPTDKSRFDLKAEENHVDFQWTTAVQTQFFLIELSQTQDFKKVLASHNIKLSKDTFKNLPSKSYYWRVRAFDSKNQEISKSPTFGFTLNVPEKIGKAKSVNPDKEGPTNFEIISPKDQTEIVRDLSVESPEPILFQWKISNSLSKPVSFTISTDPEFKEVLKQDNIKKSSLMLRLKRAGFYYWKLYSESVDGKSQILSSVATFNLKSNGAAATPEPTATPSVTPTAMPSPTPGSTAAPTPAQTSAPTSPPSSVPNSAVTPVLKDAPTLNTPVVK